LRAWAPNAQIPTKIKLTSTTASPDSVASLTKAACQRRIMLCRLAACLKTMELALWIWMDPWQHKRPMKLYFILVSLWSGHATFVVLCISSQENCLISLCWQPTPQKYVSSSCFRTFLMMRFAASLSTSQFKRRTAAISYWELKIFQIDLATLLRRIYVFFSMHTAYCPSSSCDGAGTKPTLLLTYAACCVQHPANFDFPLGFQSASDRTALDTIKHHSTEVITEGAQNSGILHQSQC
jgi:hypothetical protein